nr:hypothetical protein [Tanacetum cinerariifolium]
MGGDGIGGGDGVLKAKESEMVSMRVSLEVIDDEDVPLLDGVLDDALGAFGDRGSCFGDGVLASSYVRSMNNFLGEMIMIFSFLEALEVEFAGGEVGGAEGFGGGEFGVEGCRSKCLILEVIDDEDVPLLDGVLDDALVSWKLLRLRFEKMPWKYLRLKMSEEDDNLKNEDWEPFY